ncbi:hypothetical protein AB0J77_14865 [Micromonospora tulbaghiae]|uniref:hypothetical protein n=1 Tax=Micromonospora tulbaghiae TaxID=479978 RepID=UPI00343E2F3E
MAQQAPKPPTLRLLLATGVAAGFTIAAWTVIVLGIVTFNSIPPQRQIIYIALGLATFSTTGFLGSRYLVQRHRRNAWWDGYAASEEPSGDVIQLGDYRPATPDARSFRSGKSS